MSPAVVTEDRVRVIVNECISVYENQIGNVRHKENLAAFGDIKDILNQQKGSFATIKIVGAIVTFICMAILGLLSYLGTTRAHGLASIPVIRETIPADASN